VIDTLRNVAYIGMTYSDAIEVAAADEAAKQIPIENVDDVDGVVPRKAGADEVEGVVAGTDQFRIEVEGGAEGEGTESGSHLTELRRELCPGHVTVVTSAHPIPPPGANRNCPLNRSASSAVASRCPSPVSR
jgi:hypothetical protein